MIAGVVASPLQILRILLLVPVLLLLNLCLNSHLLKHVSIALVFERLAVLLGDVPSCAQAADGRLFIFISEIAAHLHLSQVIWIWSACDSHGREVRGKVIAVNPICCPAASNVFLIAQGNLVPFHFSLAKSWRLELRLNLVIENVLCSRLDLSGVSHSHGAEFSGSPLRRPGLRIESRAKLAVIPEVAASSWPALVSFAGTLIGKVGAIFVQEQALNVAFWLEWRGRLPVDSGEGFVHAA